MKHLKLQNIAQIKEADIEFGDLTVLVGPQATGKSIALQLLKLAIDTGYVQDELKRHGLDWRRQLPDLLDIFLGEGMSTIWRPSSKMFWESRPIDLNKLAQRKRPRGQEKLFFIPAQRVLTLRDGWPRPFTDYSAGDPFAVRDFSEKLRLLMEQEFSGDGMLFPREKRLKAAYRTMLGHDVFSGFNLTVDKSSKQKRLVIGTPRRTLPFMVWSAGQREFVPLLLGLYWLMPATKVTQREALKWVVIEEPEMGLHPKGILVTLLLVMELLSRRYKVCLSTHSPQILEFVWAINIIKGGGGTSKEVLDLFQLPGDIRSELRSVAASTLKKSIRVHFFDRDGVVRNISDLDPNSKNRSQALWGGLAEFSGNVNDVVAKLAANS